MTLPNFLIIGAMRSGTTALTHTLRYHPEVFIPIEKELNYFTTVPDKGLAWYAAFFERAGQAKRVGEATPNYMYDPQAMVRASQLLPHAKLIAILRNPIDRAYSHYWWNRLRRREPLDFLSALDAEPERIAADRVLRFQYAYVDKGFYFRQLQHVCSLFPRESLHVVLFDDLLEDPQRRRSEESAGSWRSTKERRCVT